MVILNLNFKIGPRTELDRLIDGLRVSFKNKLETIAIPNARLRFRVQPVLDVMQEIKK